MSVSGRNLPTTDTSESSEPKQSLSEAATPPASALSEIRLLAASLQAQVEEITRLATATGKSLAQLIDQSDAAMTAPYEIGRTIPRWHFEMLNDHERNDALAVALERRIVPGSSVLDIGSGTGLLAMMAIRAGAGYVISCEANPIMAEIARQTVAVNGMSDVIRIVNKRSTDLRVGQDLDKPVDFIVSEIVDCGLIGEGLLPTMAHARERLLAPDGQILPKAGKIFGVLVDSPVAANLNRVSTSGGYDVSLLNVLASHSHFPVRLSNCPYRVLSETVELVSFDLLDSALDDDHREIFLPVTASGVTQSLIAWFEMDLGAGVVVRNSPDNVGSHWEQALIPFAQPIEVIEGTTITVDLRWEGTRLSVTHRRSPEPWKACQ